MVDSPANRSHLMLGIPSAQQHFQHGSMRRNLSPFFAFTPREVRAAASDLWLPSSRLTPVLMSFRADMSPSTQPMLPRVA